MGSIAMRCPRHAGVEKGIDEDEMVAMEMGARLEGMTDLQVLGWVGAWGPG